MVSDNLISEQGKDWLTVALDPFHDHQLKNLAGWPDVQTGASVVRCVKQAVTIQIPAGQSGNWDCHIVQWPWLTASQSGTATGNYVQSVARNGELIVASTLAAPLPVNSKVGGLQAFFVPAGQDLQITQPPGTTLLIASMDVPQAYTKGVTRLIGMGFEVHNTTSQLNIQGAVLGYRQMANENVESKWFLTDGVTQAGYSGPLVRYPPANAAAALLLAGTRQWEAKEGIYSVSAFHTTENPATLISPSTPVITTSGNEDFEGVIATSNVYYAQPGPILTSNVRGNAGFRVFNIHQSGAIFTGLSESTTLTINWNVFLETFPGVAESEILPLATPSAEFDPDVLDLYSRVSVDLPVAVPVRENGLGDWFYDAATTAAKYIGPILSALPNPIAKGAGMAITGFGDVLEQNKAPKPGKRRPAAQPPTPPPNTWAPMVPAARRRTQKGQTVVQPLVTIPARRKRRKNRK